MMIIFLPSETTTHHHSSLSVPSFPSIPTRNDAEWLNAINKKSLRLNTLQNQYNTKEDPTTATATTTTTTTTTTTSGDLVIIMNWKVATMIMIDWIGDWSGDWIDD